MLKVVVSILLILGLSKVQAGALFPKEILTLNFQINYHFSNKVTQSKWTATIESNYWKVVEGVPLGVNLGYEFGENTSLVYSELQTGIALLGISSGGYIDFSHDIDWGWQNSFWANYGLGIMYRNRNAFSKRTRDIFSSYLTLPVWLD